MTKDCMVCGDIHPTSHVLVWDVLTQKAIGVVCASHTLKEVIEHRSDRFAVTVEHVNPNEIEGPPG